MKKSKTTLSDVAAAAGVSVSTVSLVLSDSAISSIPLSTQMRVREAAKTLHYLPRPKKASSLKPSLPVLILTSDLTNPYYPLLVERLERAAEKHDLQFLCCNTYHQVERERFLLSQAEKGQFFAAVFLYPPDDPEYADKINRRLPVIAICDKDAALGIDLIELTITGPAVLRRSICSPTDTKRSPYSPVTPHAASLAPTASRARPTPLRRPERPPGFLLSTAPPCRTFPATTRITRPASFWDGA